MRREIPEPQGFEKPIAEFQRAFLRFAFKPFIGPRLSIAAQRFWVAVLACIMPGRGGVQRNKTQMGTLSAEVVIPKSQQQKGVILHIHGGGFSIGNAYTHRSITTHLAAESGMPVCVPNYRLVPEHPYPACFDDALTAYTALRSQGYAAHDIVVSGDSAGATLALALVIHLKQIGQVMPAGLILISPLTNLSLRLNDTSPEDNADPMVGKAWLNQVGTWLKLPPHLDAFTPLSTNLTGLPPTLIQVGENEILLTDSEQLSTRLLQQGVACELEVYLKRWHVFHLQSFYMASSLRAIQEMAKFARKQIRN